jgi:hypothetical protein
MATAGCPPGARSAPVCGADTDRLAASPRVVEALHTIIAGTFPCGFARPAGKLTLKP